MFEGPVHVAHSPLQVSHVFVEVLGYFPAGHVVEQELPSKNLSPVQLSHSVFEGPEQVAHSVSHTSQVFVLVFPNLPAGHIARH